MTKMTLTDPEWTLTETARGFADDETPTVARAAADAVYAWLVNNTAQRLPGWAYADGSFTGPARADALDAVLSLIVEANDHVIGWLPELRTECA